MKKFLVALGLMATSAMALAADPIVGVWQTYEDGQAKAQVEITQTGNTFSGKIVHGNTAKAKEYVGKPVLTNVKALGGGKYSGKAKDPRWGLGLGADIAVNGSSLTIKVPVKGTQKWQKIK